MCIMNSTAFKGVQKGHVCLRSRVELTSNVTTIAHTLRVILQHVVLRKKSHKVWTRYMASNIHADILAWLGFQQRSYSASEFPWVELDKEKVHSMCTRHHSMLSHGCLANVAIWLSSFT